MIINNKGEVLGRFINFKRIGEDSERLEGWALAHSPATSEIDESNYRLEMVLFALLNQSEIKGK